MLKISKFYNRNKRDICNGRISNVNAYYWHTNSEWIRIYKFIKLGYIVFLCISSICYIIAITIYLFNLGLISYLLVIFGLPVSICLQYISLKGVKIFMNLDTIGKENTIDKYSNAKNTTLNFLLTKYFINKIKRFNYYNQSEIHNISNSYFIILYLTIFIVCTIFQLNIFIKLLIYLR